MGGMAFMSFSWVREKFLILFHMPIYFSAVYLCMQSRIALTGESGFK